MAVPPRYQEWLEFCFGRTGDETDPFRMDWDFDAPPEELAELFVYTMKHSGSDLIGYSDRQLSIGLQALMFNNFSTLVFELMQPRLGDDLRVEAIRSLGALYSKCLEKRSPPVLGCRSESIGNPLEFFTYMLWDVTPLDQLANREGPCRNELLQVWRSALGSSNEACIESALHGLGHASGGMRKRAEAIIDDWIDDGPRVRPELIEYARAARTGCIL